MRGWRFFLSTLSDAQRSQSERKVSVLVTTYPSDLLNHQLLADGDCLAVSIDIGLAQKNK
jgi:hypothetical protein